MRTQEVFLEALQRIHGIICTNLKVSYKTTRAQALKCMFGINKNKNERKISSLFDSFKFDDKYLYFKGLSQGGFRVLKEDIESVSIDVNPEIEPSSSFSRLLKINGRGTLLGQARIHQSFAEKAQDFILEEIKDNNKSTSQTASNNLDDLEKLASLKDKGIITQEEFDAKKKQILGL